MRLSNKSTFSLICLIFLMAFVAVPVMAHQVTKAEVAGADDAAKTAAVDLHNEDPDDATDTDVSADHALVSSITLNGTNLTAANTITATITLASGVATITDDATTTSGDGHNEARHGTLTDSAAVLTATDIDIDFGTKATDGTFTYADPTGSGPARVLSIARTVPPGTTATGRGAVYTVVIGVPATIADADDGMYQISVSKADVFNPETIKPTFLMDTHAPVVTNVAVRPIGQNYANADGEWGDPFEITFNLEDPSFDRDNAGEKIADSDFEASELDLSTIMFEVKKGTTVTTSELRIRPGDVAYTGSEYVVTATPVKSATADKAAATVSVTVKVSDKAGNEGSSAPPTTVKLAARTRTGPGQGETQKPTLSSITAPDEPEDDGTLVFTITFSEAIAVTGTNAFTADDLKVSNAASSTLTSTDNTVFKLTVTPDNKDFGVKVEFQANVMVQDTNGNVSLAISGEDTYTPEGVLGVTITAPTEPALDGRLVFTFTFAQEPEDEGAGAFTISDITTSNTAALEDADLSQSLNDAKVFRLRVTPTDATMPVTVQLNADSVRHHGPGEDGTLGTDAVPSEDDVFLVAGEIPATYTPPTPDTTAPVVTITAPTAAGASNSLMFMIDFDEELSAALTLANLDINGAATTPTASDLTSVTTGLPTDVAQRYTLSVTGTPGTAVTVNLMANAVEDAAGNSVAPLANAATFTITAPVVTITAPTAAGTNNSLMFMISFNKALSAALTVANLDINGAAATPAPALASVTANESYRLTVTGTPGTAVTVNLKANAVMDTSGNSVAPLANAATFTIPTIRDTTAPEFTVSTTPANGADLTAAGAPTQVQFNLTASEALGSGNNELLESNISLTNSTSQSFFRISNTQYLVTATPMDNTMPIVLTIAAGAVMDTASNANAVQKFTFTPLDTVAPTVTITSAMGTGDDAGKIVFTFTFSESVQDFDENDIIRGTGVTLSGNLQPNTDMTVFTIAVNPAPAGSPTSLTLRAGAVTDGRNTLVGDQLHTHATVATITTTDLGTVTAGATLTITFSKDPGTVTTAAGNTLAGSGTTRTITAATTAGSHSVALTWTGTEDAASDDGTGTVTYTIPEPTLVPATIPTKALGNTTPGGTLTVTFSKDPGTVATTATGYMISTAAGTTRTITVPADKGIGSHSIALTWANGGSGTVTYTIPASADPTMPANIMKVNIPGNSFVILVRANNSSVAALNFPTVPPVGGTAVDVREWAAMPDLYDLFSRSAQNRGGALVLRKSVDDAAASRPAVGTVGISEIMWGRDLGMTTATEQAAGQWIELQNLNSTAVNVLIYAQKGSDGLISGGQLQNTAAGDSLLGNPGNMVVDAIQNIRNDGNANAGGWDVKGKQGNSLTGQPFASMYRILPDKKSKYANADGSRFNNRKGTNGGHWAESGDVYLRGKTAATPPVLFDYKGTPGAVNNVPAVSILTRQGRSFKPASNTIVINEVGNNSNDNYDWIELRNVSGGNINLRNYLITMVRDSNTEHVVARFAANDNAQVAAGAVFLMLRTDPANDSNHPIAATGYNVDLSREEQQPGTPNSPVRYKVFGSLVLPNDDGQKFVLMVRRPDSGHNNGPGGHKDQGTSETASQQNGGADLDKIVDIAGYDDNLGKSGYPNSLSSTNLWPLYDFAGPRSNKNTFRLNTVLQRNRLTTKHDLGGTGIEGDDGNKPAFGGRGWTGVGYRRDTAATGMHGGTPGYPNGALHGAGGTITAAVYISEIMYADAGNDSFPQWIELRNPSSTVGADLHNWRLTIRNHADLEMHNDGGWNGKVESTILLRGLKIKPNGSVLITSRKGPRSQVHLADSEIFSLFPSHRGAFGMQNANTDVINPFGFRITLHANGHEGDRNKWQKADDVGNLAAVDPSARRGDNDRFDMPRWMLPDGNMEDGSRSSIVRKVKNKDTLAAADGSKKWSWSLSSMDRRTNLIDQVYYGNINDMSTPGQTVGQALPVSLSHFRPTLEDGKVVIRWVTESELDNAGFNIYRSETRDGEFTRVNEDMIQGNGTTAERSTYKWVDSSAKIGAVYYYQIEDVSFAGERQKLTTTKLKGLISAKGKLTTQWGELKEVQ